MYRVCIPTAGIGSRLKTLTKYINKSLVPLANKPTISHIIAQYPDETEFVIALGYKGSLVKEFLELAYPKRKFIYETVNPFEGEGSGLGLSLLACKKHLQQPFIFNSCDTLVLESIPDPDYNWMGHCKMDKLDQYRTVEVTNKFISGVFEKSKTKKISRSAYIGLAGICDFHSFWEFLKESTADVIQTGEVYSLSKMLENSSKIFQKSFSWFDTGNLESLEKARQYYQEAETPNILEKESEAIWFINNTVVKFNSDKNFIENRVKRAKKLESYVPKVIGRGENMYSYKMVGGVVVSDALTIPKFEELLKYCENFWKIRALNKTQQKKFEIACFDFYKNKTIKRVDEFYKKFEKQDSDIQLINGVKMPSLSSLFKKIDWIWLSEGIAVRFHGDFHFENILINDNKFTFLDWRQDFAGNLDFGDLYYDLAKLLHGIIVSHRVINKNLFSVKWTDDNIEFDLYRTQKLVESEMVYYEWLRKKGYDVKKVKLITGLIYLNIACLHHFPYCLMLFALGKSLLHKELNT